MSDNYLEKLNDWVKKEAEKNNPKNNQNKVAFLALIDDIEKGLGAGHSVRTICRHMNETGLISCSYKTFLKHVKNHIKNRPPKAPNQTQPVSVSTPPKPAASPQIPLPSEGPRELKIENQQFDLEESNEKKLL